MASTPKVVFLGHNSLRGDGYGYGIGRVRAYAQARGLDAEMVHVDRKANSREDEDLALIVEQEPDVVGLSAYPWSIKRVTRLVPRLREELPGALLVIGGPSALGYSRYAPDAAGPDFTVGGEGEEPFLQLMQAHNAGELDKAGKTIKGVLPWVDGQPVRCQPEASHPVESLPSPYLMNLLNKDSVTMYWQTSRGCPLRCSFCQLSAAPENRMRYFPLYGLEQELRWALKNGRRIVNLTDSALNYHTDRLDAFTAMVNRVDPDGEMEFIFPVQTDYLNDEQIRLLGRFNDPKIGVGLNSVTPGTFDGVTRKILPEKFARAVEKLNEVCRPVVTVVMGLPGETVEGWRDTIEFCRTLKADVKIFELMVIPHTTYFDRPEEFGLQFDPEDNWNVTASHSFTPEDLDAMRRLTFDFYVEQDARQGTAHTKPLTVARGLLEKHPTERYVLTRMGLLAAEDEETPFEMDGWQLAAPVRDDPKRLRVQLRHHTGEEADLLVALRDEQDRCFVRTELFNVSYSSKGGDTPGPNLARLLKRFLVKLTRLERTVAQQPQGQAPLVQHAY